MSGSGFGVSPEELQFAGSMLGELRDELQVRLARLGADVDEVTGSRWAGDAASGFVRGWQEFLDGATETLQALGRMGQLLAATGAGYAEVETDTGALIKAVA